MSWKNPITVKLLINKEKNKVVFVESEGDLVDVLFSFLILPMGTITRLLDPLSSVGSIDNLYKSVTKINKEHFQTQECHNMLTRPRSAYEAMCKKLKIKIDDGESTRYYMCPESMCSYDMLSTVENSKCLCGEVMTEEKEIVSDNDGFVERVTKYIITDDLSITSVSSTATAFLLMKELGVEKDKLLKRPEVLDRNKVLFLLERALISNEPFTDVFLRKQQLHRGFNPSQNDIFELIKRHPDLGNSKSITLKLLVSKSTKKVMFAEAGAGFLDFLFSFLTLPLGSIVKLLDGNSSLECVDNLYRSVNNMVFNNCMKTQKYCDFLLDPKLPQHFKCSSQLLEIEEESPLQYCHLCFEGRLHSELFPCSVHERQVELNVINPKCPAGKTTTGGGYVKDDVTCMVTDKLGVSILSPMQAYTHLSNSNMSVNDIEELIVGVAEEESLKLLKASLTSKTVLNDVFGPK